VALVTALLFFVVLAGISFFSLRSAMVQGERSSLRESSMRALEMAEVGVSEALYELGRNLDLDGENGIGAVTGGRGGGTYSTRVVHLALNRWRIVAQGEHDGVKEVIEVVVVNDSAPFVRAISAVESVRVSNITTDQYDSDEGDYASQAVNLDAGGPYAEAAGGDVASNGDLDLENPYVRGDALAGPGVSVTATSKTTVTGTMGSLTEPMEIPDPDYDLFLAAWNDNDNASIPTAKGVSYDEATRVLTVDGGAKLHLPSGTYALNRLLVSGNASIIVTGPVKIYIREHFNASGGTIVNESGISSNLQIIAHPYSLPGATDPVALPTATITGGTQMALVLYAPGFQVDVLGGSAIYGSIVGRSVTLTGSPTSMHFDEALGRVRNYVDYQNFRRLSWRLLSLP
jgi:hypothetical protein